MAKIGLTVTKDRVTDIAARITDLAGHRVQVGIAANRKARSDDGPDNVTLAYIHEFGSPAQNIPERPFLRPGVEDAKGEITAAMRMAAVAALNGDQGGVLVAMDEAGQAGQQGVQDRIESGPFVPNAPSTIARKGSSKPLINTRQLKESIGYTVKRREG